MVRFHRSALPIIGGSMFGLNVIIFSCVAVLVLTAIGDFINSTEGRDK